MNKKEFKTALYTRVSTEDQAREGYSLAVQRDYLIDFAKKQGWEIHFADSKSKIYVDDGYSGYSQDRPALVRLLEDARAKKFNLVLVYKLDRFSRRLKDILNLIDELDALGIEFKSATEPYETTTSSGKLMLQQLGSFAEFERNRIIERVFPGMVRGVKDGHWQGARYAPFGYGYNKDRKTLEIIEEEAGIVRRIFDRYLKGESCQKIGGDLFDKKVPTRSGGLFNSSLVRKILRNKIYTGKLVWNVHHYDRQQKTYRGFRYVKNDLSKIVEAQGGHKAIVSEDIFQQAQSILDNNRKGKGTRHRQRDYLLSGVVKCAKCGSHYHGVSNVKNHKTGEKRPYYRCSGRSMHNIKCGNGDVRAELLEDQVFEILDTLFSSEAISLERMKNLVADQYRDQATGEVAHQLDQLKKELETCILNQSKIADAYLEGTISKGVFEQKSLKLRNDEGEIRIKVERMELQLLKKEESRDYIRRAQEVVRSTQSVRENLHPVTRKEFLRLIFKKLPIENQSVSEFELYEPFKSMYESALRSQKENASSERRCEKWNKETATATKSQSCLLRPSDVK